MLSPKCLHLLSLVVSLEVEEGEDPPRVSSEGDAEHEDEAPVAPLELTESQCECARDVTALLAKIFSDGFANAGVVRQGELLGRAHNAKVHKLYALSATLIRIVKAMRALARRAPEFELAELKSSAALAIECASRLSHGFRVGAQDVGEPRAPYRAISMQRLFGFFSEAQVRSGYAGVTTVMVSESGLYSLNDIRPASDARPEQVYRQGVSVGDLSLSHQALARCAFFLSEGTASASGRLGQGKNVKAVSAEGKSWAEAPFLQYFERPLSAQLEALFEQREREHARRSCGWDLLFVTGRFVEGGRIFEFDNNQSVKLKISTENSRFRYRENLSILGKSAARFRMVARMSFSKGLALEPLACSPLVEELALPTKLKGVICLGLDKLEGANVSVSAKVGSGARVIASDTRVDPIAAMDRVLERTVLGGRRHLPISMRADVQRIERDLSAQMLAGAALCLKTLFQLAKQGPKTGGTEVNDEAFALAFARGHAYVERLRALELKEAWKAISLPTEDQPS